MRALARGVPFCCGLREIGGFGSYERISKDYIKRTQLAYICVTRWSDVREKVTLRKWGFKRVGRWKNPNTGRMLTLWAYVPRKKKK